MVKRQLPSEDTELQLQKVVEPVVEPSPVAAPLPAVLFPEKPYVGLDVYLAICGLKPDQMAGFRHYARAKNLDLYTIDEWKAAYAAFMNRPVA